MNTPYKTTFTEDEIMAVFRVSRDDIKNRGIDLLRRLREKGARQ